MLLFGNLYFYKWQLLLNNKIGHRFFVLSYLYSCKNIIYS